VQHIHKPLTAAGFSQGDFTAAAAVGGIAFPEVSKLVYELELLVRKKQENMREL
jgi:malonyl CoA-acyl carrier protein transacylase